MNNPFIYSDDNKRYYTFYYYLKQTFKQKVFRLPLNAGFSCPHIRADGGGGCTFCSIDGSGDFACASWVDLKEQLKQQEQIMRRKWPNGLAMAYFQAYTNTYAPLESLKEIYDPFFSDEIDVVGVALGTRADCLDQPIIDYFQQKSLLKPVYMEIGVQTIHESTAKAINRQHTLAQVEEVLARLKDTNIHVILHIINGFKQEDKEMMLKTAKWVAQQPIFGVKIHMLHILKNTTMGLGYSYKPYPLLTQDEYVDIVIRQLEILPEGMVVLRLTGDGKAEDLLAPTWTLNKVSVLNQIDKEMVVRNTWQGKYATR